MTITYEYTYVGVQAVRPQKKTTSARKHTWRVRLTGRAEGSGEKNKREKAGVGVRVRRK